MVDLAKLRRVLTGVLVLALIEGPVVSELAAADKAPSAAEIRDEADRQRSLELPSVLGSQSSDIQKVCAGQVPAGWIKTNDEWNPTVCGNPITIVYNVWTIERYDNKPFNSVMTACDGAVPAGWAKLNGTWNPTRCGYPSAIANNVMTIKGLADSGVPTPPAGLQIR